MATGYIIEVQKDKQTKYMTSGGKLTLFPKVFTNAGFAKNAITRNRLRRGYGDNVADDDITVIRIERLESGLRQSHATNFKVDAFMNRSFSSGKPSIPNNPNAIYKLKLNVLDLAANSPAVFVKGSGDKARFGKLWNSAGHLRRHLTDKINLMYAKYNNAQVLEIEMHLDGITPKVVKTYNVAEFYCASPSCKKIHNSRHPAFRHQ